MRPRFCDKIRLICREGRAGVNVSTGYAMTSSECGRSHISNVVCSRGR